MKDQPSWEQEHVEAVVDRHHEVVVEDQDQVKPIRFYKRIQAGSPVYLNILF